MTICYDLLLLMTHQNDKQIQNANCSQVAFVRCGMLCAVLVMLVLTCGFGCAGYQIGTDSLYNTEIKTVHVPIFQSDSYRQNMGERLTEAVIRRIEQRTPYKVVHRPNGADSILSGRLTNESQSVSIVDDYAGTRQKKVELTVYVQWKDRRGSMVRTLSPIAWNDAPVDITTSSDMVAEMGHSYATASQDAIDKMADQIVDMMQMPW